MDLEKTKVIKWIKGMDIRQWYDFSMIFDCEEELKDKIFNCQRCRKEYGDCGEHEGNKCMERFKEHSMRELE
jgi:hypothetical protein